jgi:hypothetical protein
MGNSPTDPYTMYGNYLAFPAPEFQSAPQQNYGPFPWDQAQPQQDFIAS